jgi:maltose alpha-D-glucosyltransferase/alpha-amylase
MQWEDGRTAGFSQAQPAELVRPVPRRGAYAPQRVNVRAQQRDPHSLLRWFENLTHTVREAPEIGTGRCSVVDLPLPRSVLAHRFDGATGAILLLHNLADTPLTVDVGRLPGMAGEASDILVDGPYDPPGRRLTGLALNGWGYRWIRLSRTA